jgi:hypothetical protein
MSFILDLDPQYSYSYRKYEHQFMAANNILIGFVKGVYFNTIALSLQRIVVSDEFLWKNLKCLYSNLFYVIL